MLIPCYRFCPPKSCAGFGMRGHRNFGFSPLAIEIAPSLARCCPFLRGTRDRLHDRSDCCAPLRTVAPFTPMLTQLCWARCGIVRHRRCPNTRVPRSTPSAYSQRVAPLGARLQVYVIHVARCLAQSSSARELQLHGKAMDPLEPWTNGATRPRRPTALNGRALCCPSHA
jgi:hypothetical protein